MGYSLFFSTICRPTCVLKDPNIDGEKSIKVSLDKSEFRTFSISTSCPPQTNVPLEPMGHCLKAHKHYISVIDFTKSVEAVPAGPKWKGKGCESEIDMLD